MENIHLVDPTVKITGDLSLCECTGESGLMVIDANTNLRCIMNNIGNLPVIITGLNSESFRRLANVLAGHKATPTLSDSSLRMEETWWLPKASTTTALCTTESCTRLAS